MAHTAAGNPHSPRDHQNGQNRSSPKTHKPSSNISGSLFRAQCSHREVREMLSSRIWDTPGARVRETGGSADDGNRFWFLARSCPVRAVEAAVLDRLGDVLGLEVGGVFQISDGSGDLQDAVVGAGAQPLLGHRALEQALAIRREFAEECGCGARTFGRCSRAFRGRSRNVRSASGGCA